MAHVSPHLFFYGLIKEVHGSGAVAAVSHQRCDRPPVFTGSERPLSTRHTTFDRSRRCSRRAESFPGNPYVQSPQPDRLLTRSTDLPMKRTSFAAADRR
ncbi:MAG: hypothetical protein CMJ59_25820 [Planctomycetaceae bacterium]|nr:hypothetical protein [Planctomycetaceae bacterium]